MAENPFACKILVVSLYFQNDVHQAPCQVANTTGPQKKYLDGHVYLRFDKY